MAIMMPERLPARASRGEERLWAILKKLPDDCIVYYEPLVRDRYPDIIVLLPALGVLVIEVKGWHLGWIISAENDRIQVRERGIETAHPHPKMKARQYMLRLMDEARRQEFAKCLLHESGDLKGRFVFPFGHFALLSNVTRSQLESRDPILGRIFKSPGTLTRDQIEEWELMDCAALLDALKIQFEPFWPVEGLNERQINAIRAIIHPIYIKPIRAGSTELRHDGTQTLKVLDLKQEREARNIGSGHRIVRGIPGSGKTVLLVARAKMQAGDPNKQVLVLCFNKLLAAYFRSCFSGSPNIKATTFHRWGSENGIRFDGSEDRDGFGNRLLERLERGEGDAGRYDTVLVDEYQDFPLSWLKCAKLALQDPEDGDLLIVGDAAQALYKQKTFRWIDAGIKAVGRTAVLKTNYRNTKEIVAVAAPFGTANCGSGSEDRDVCDAASVQSCVRSGPPVEVIQCRDLYAEVDAALGRIRGWVAGDNALSIKLRPHEIGVLYPRLESQDHRDELRRLRAELRDYGAVQLSGVQADGAINDPGVKISTILSSRGLQFRAVILLWAALLPSRFQDRNEIFERNLIYVALTRAEEIAAVTHSGWSPYVQELCETL